MFLVGMVELVLAQGVDFVAPLYLSFVIDAIEKEKFDEIGPLCLQLFLIVLVSGTFHGLRASHFQWMSECVASLLRLDLFECIVKKDIEYFEENRTGDLISRLISDTTTVQENMTTQLNMFLKSSLTIVIFLVIMFY
jgi:ATP-binding cassette subfamily B (MDR/TAP) protein 9